MHAEISSEDQRWIYLEKSDDYRVFIVYEFEACDTPEHAMALVRAGQTDFVSYKNKLLEFTNELNDAGGSVCIPILRTNVLINAELDVSFDSFEMANETRQTVRLFKAYVYLNGVFYHQYIIMPRSFLQGELTPPSDIRPPVKKSAQVETEL